MAQTKIWDGTKWVDYIMSSQIKLPLGSIGFSLDGILPEGAIAATGLELSREVYKDLWGFAQKGGETRLISEEAWQAELAADFNDDPIDIPIDPSSPSPAVDVYFKVLTNGTTTMGYNVTLYSPKGNVIWQGVTNSQGYVQLDPTLSFYAEDGMTLRAMKGSKFTQITVNKDSFSTDKADSNNAIWFTLTVGEMG